MSLGWISPQKIPRTLFSSDGANELSGSWNIMWIPSFLVRTDDKFFFTGGVVTIEIAARFPG